MLLIVVLIYLLLSSFFLTKQRKAAQLIAEASAAQDAALRKVVVVERELDDARVKQRSLESELSTLKAKPPTVVVAAPTVAHTPVVDTKAIVSEAMQVQNVKNLMCIFYLKTYISKKTG